MALVLLPDWNQQPNWDGVLGNVVAFDPAKRTLREVKDDWLPQFDDVAEVSQAEAFAFPTPFAWAEMMTAVIEQNRFQHILFKLYQDLVLGLTLGFLRVEITDLQSHGFGRVLAQTDDDYRYFGLLRGRGTDEARELEGKVYGGTSPETLFWPAPRRNQEDWEALHTAITRHPQYNQAYQLLADFRALLQDQGLWNAETVAWCRGLQEIIGARAPHPEQKTFNLHSRTVGPIYAKSVGHTCKPLYFPVYQEEFALDFLRGLTGTFRANAERAGVVSVFDQYGNRCFDIANPTLQPNSDLIRAGVGTVEMLRPPTRDTANAVPRLKDQETAGLFSHLQNLIDTLGRRSAEGLNIANVKQQPYFYPDVVRVPVSRLGEAGLGQDVSFSRPAYALTYDPASAGLPLASELEPISTTDANQSGEPLEEISAATSGVALHYLGDNNKPQKAIYIERHGEAIVGDLRALGWVLWCYFVGSADDAEDLRDVVEIVNGRLVNGEGTRLFKEQGAARPFDFSDSVATDIYRRIKDDAHKPRRLAAQQRFLRAYRDLQHNQPHGLHKLCYRAAQSLVHWAWPEWAGSTFLPNGHRPQTQESVTLGTQRVTLWRDN